jgi:plastocyanin
MCASKILQLAILGGAFIAANGAAWADATIQGRVSLAKAEKSPVMNKRYSMTARGGLLTALLPRAVVYLEGDFPKPSAPPSRVLAQQGIEFLPYLLPVQVGTRVWFPNQDTTAHNVYSESSAKEFDFGRIVPDEHPIPSKVFDRPGVVTVRCDIHENMRAEIVVLDTPYFVVTDPDGNFRLGGLPVGHYVLKVWLSRQTTLERPVDLRDGAALTADFP